MGTYEEVNLDPRSLYCKKLIEYSNTGHKYYQYHWEPNYSCVLQERFGLFLCDPSIYLERGKCFVVFVNSFDWSMERVDSSSQQIKRRFDCRVEIYSELSLFPDDEIIDFVALSLSKSELRYIVQSAWIETRLLSIRQFCINLDILSIDASDHYIFFKKLQSYSFRIYHKDFVFGEGQPLGVTAIYCFVKTRNIRT